MSRALRVVCRPAVAAGFALAGLRALEAETPDAAEAHLRTQLDDPQAGVVLVEQSLHDALPEALHRELGRRALPVVVPFPGPAREGAAPGAEALIVEILRQAIGYRVRLR